MPAYPKSPNHQITKSKIIVIYLAFGVATAILYPAMYTGQNQLTENLDISSDWLVDSIPTWGV